MKFEYKLNFKCLKKSCEGYFSNHFFFNLENATNAILQILTLVLFYRLIVGANLGFPKRNKVEISENALFYKCRNFGLFKKAHKLLSWASELSFVFNKNLRSHLESFSQKKIQK